MACAKQTVTKRRTVKKTKSSSKRRNTASGKRTKA